jgi:hypothetical protein
MPSSIWLIRASLTSSQRQVTTPGHNQWSQLSALTGSVSPSIAKYRTARPDRHPRNDGLCFARPTFGAVISTMRAAAHADTGPRQPRSQSKRRPGSPALPRPMGSHLRNLCKQLREGNKRTRRSVRIEDWRCPNAIYHEPFVGWRLHAQPFPAGLGQTRRLAGSPGGWISKEKLVHRLSRLAVLGLAVLPAVLPAILLAGCGGGGG